MKKLLITLFVVVFALTGKSQSQSGNSVKDAAPVILENDKVKVTEFVSNPGADACGKGKHSHNERLVIAITDASIKMTTEDWNCRSLL